MNALFTSCLCAACASVADPAYSEKFRRESEARHVAGLADDAERKDYINGVRRKRGLDAAISLRAAARSLMEAEAA